MGIRSAFAAVGLLAGSMAGAQDAAQVQASQEMVEAASALLATVERDPGGGGILGFDVRANLSLPLDHEARENWAYWPTERVGVPIELMTTRQRQLVHELLTSLLSSNGYLKVVSIMQLEQVLDMLEQGGLPRSVDHYELVLFGTPSMQSPWAWRFEGHHVSLNVSVAPSGVAVTPSFFGSNPAEVRNGPLTGFRVHGAQEDIARELVASFSDAQRSRAIVSAQAPGDIFTGNIRRERVQWDEWKETLQPEGIRVANLNEVQKHWVRRILDEVVGNYRPELSAAYLRAIDVEDLSFAWMGSTERGAPHYFRLQGADFVFEYDNVQNDGNHVHSVWRSKSEDFGMKLLGNHYRTSHN